MDCDESMFRLIGFYDYTVVLTYLSLLSAVFGIVQASRGSFTVAVICLFFSGVCDAFDGIVARSKKNRTDDEKSFGIQIDSLCDLISFGVFPAMLCYYMGVDTAVGVVICFIYCLCAVIRLAFFNVLEGNRQKSEGGCNKTYRGLPVTAVSLFLPVFYILRFLLRENAFSIVLHVVLFLIAFLFVLDFSVRKPDWKKILTGKA